MAQITINEISENYTYSIGTSSFATVALPITACWGPGYFGDVDKVLIDDQNAVCAAFSDVSWDKFPANQSGIESFVAAYRGPAANYQSAQDFSYQMALTLLSSGYDVLVCRVCPGARAAGTLKSFRGTKSGSGMSYTAVGVATLSITARYPGTFGNRLWVEVRKNRRADSAYTIIVYTLDSSGIRTALENITCVMDLNDASDTLLHISEVISQFVSFKFEGDATNLKDIYFGDMQYTNKLAPVNLEGGTDRDKVTGGRNADGSIANKSEVITAIRNLAKARFDATASANDEDLNKDANNVYMQYLRDNTNMNSWDDAKLEAGLYREWLFTAVVGNSIMSRDASGDLNTIDTGVYSLLKDKLAYNPNRIISPGWDDQDMLWLKGVIVPTDEDATDLYLISPIHVRLMDVGYNSRCGTSLLDIPRCLSRCHVYNEDINGIPGYAQKLARNMILNSFSGTTDAIGLYPTHSALFAPWGQYRYTGTGKMHLASPSFLALLIHRAQVLNQSARYEWILPTNRKHNLRIGKLDYIVPKKLMDMWQKLEGVGINIITKVPDLGINIWGNSTLFEVPEATYQALANLSTRYLVNAVEDVAYKCGISITFQYNNEQAYNQFYAGVTPILDTMKNVGAIVDYRVKMAADIDGLDQVNANSVVGKIILIVNGVVNDITVDLIALPPSADIDSFVTL